MSLRRFLNVAYNILVEEYQRMGVDLISALEKVAEMAEGARVEPVPAGRSPQVVAQNEQAMSMLTAHLANVQGAPTKKPRRAR